MLCSVSQSHQQESSSICANRCSAHDEWTDWRLQDHSRQFEKKQYGNQPYGQYSIAVIISRSRIKIPIKHNAPLYHAISFYQQISFSKLLSNFLYSTIFRRRYWQRTMTGFPLPPFEPGLRSRVTRVSRAPVLIILSWIILFNVPSCIRYTRALL